MAHGPLSQCAFLCHTGLSTRINTLQCTAASPKHADELDKAATQLVDPVGMGKEYKVMGVTSGAVCMADADGVWPFIAGKLWKDDAAATQTQHLAQDTQVRDCKHW
jgi:NADH dehydrogenase [ubiquinone] 1 alpha subcomplex assembly factor 7